jgi:hypothetical protein
MKAYLIPVFAIFCIACFFSSCVPEETENEVTPDYSGSYSCKETTSNPSGTTTFTVHLKKQSTGETYNLENFYNVGFNYSANLNFSGSGITIPNQTVSGFTASGSGSVQSDGKISLSYRVDDGSGSGADNCSATLTKQ